MNKVKRERSKRICEGDVVVMEFSTNLYCFGQVLTHGGFLVFKYTPNELPKTIEEITTKPRLARTLVNYNLRLGYWDRVGKADIAPDLIPAKYFKTNTRVPGLFDLIVDDVVTEEVTKDRVIGLPHCQIWDPETLQERIRQYFFKEKDPWDKIYGKLGHVLR